MCGRARTPTLRSSEEQFRLLFEGNPNPMWICDAESQELIAVNDAAITQYGYSRGELLKMTVKDLPCRERAARLPRAGPMHVLRKDGNAITVELNGYDIRLPGRRARMTMAIDANEGRRAAESLRESERRFREMLDTIELAAVLLDVVGIVTYCNPYLLSITGYDKDEVIGRNFFEMFLPEEQREQAAREFNGNIGRGVLAAHLEMEIVTRDGERRIILWNNTVLRNAAGQHPRDRQHRLRCHRAARGGEAAAAQRVSRCADRPAEPRALPRPRRSGADAHAARPGSHSRSCSSTSITSRTSTTASATWPATSCWSPSASACRSVCARSIPWRASAATSSRS